eukprot:Em0180g1a
MEVTNKVCNDDLRRFCKEGNLKEIKRIVDILGKSALGFDERFRNGTLWYTPLHEAAANGHEALLDYWLEFGFDVNCRTPGGDTPLHVAAGNGRVDCVRVLLKRNAEVGAQNNIGKTPRQSAEQCSSAERRAECSRVLTSEEIINDVRNNGEHWMELLLDNPPLLEDCLSRALVAAVICNNPSNIGMLVIKGAPNVTEAIELAVNELKHNAHAMLLLMMAVMKNDCNLVQKMFTVQENDNELQEVVKMDIQFNELNAIPGTLLELPNLVNLNISNNNSPPFLHLGKWSQSLAILNVSFNRLNTIPGEPTASSINTLNLANNELSAVPLCICSFTTLQFLDLSNNKVIGYFKSKSLPTTGYYRMKLMLVGKQNRGKTTLAARLQGRSCGNTSTVGVDVNEWEYKPSIGKKSFQFSIWDFGGQEEYYATHQCFLSERALYLVLFNLLHGVEGMKYLQHQRKEKADKLLQKAADIAGGFCNKLQIYQVMAVGLKDPLEGVTDLRDSIYHYSKLNKQILWFQKRARQCNLIPIMNKEEFKALVKDLSLTDIHGDNELKLATTFLTDIGTLLYYDDRSHHLDELYFLDPQWLCDMMAKEQDTHPFHAIRDIVPDLLLQDISVKYLLNISELDYKEEENLVLGTGGFGKVYRATNLTPIGARGIIGTKGFIAPEVLHVGKKREQSLYDHKADIFSFGMFLYQMIYRRHPFHDMLPVRIDSAVENGERPSLSHCKACAVTEKVFSEAGAGHRENKKTHTVDIDIKDYASTITTEYQDELETSITAVDQSWIQCGAIIPFCIKTTQHDINRPIDVSEEVHGKETGFERKSKKLTVDCLLGIDFLNMVLYLIVQGTRYLSIAILAKGVNSMTQKDAYPLPRIDETLEALTGSQFFTTLDLASGYWQVEMEEADRKKTAFSTREGHFEFNVMPFGLTNAPATFQRLMECVLAGLTYEQCLIYLDDIVVFSVTFDQHLERLKMVFHHLAEAGLKLKPSKCHFAKSEIRYLGHIVSRQGIQADPDKTSAMISFPVPSDIKELRQFLGLTNYYRRFIKGYSSIAEPLHKLTRKTEGGFKWNSECQNAFQHLKHLLVSPPILAYPQFQLPFVVALMHQLCNRYWRKNNTLVAVSPTIDIAIKYRAGKSNGGMSRRRPDEEKLPVVNDGVFVNGITCLGDQVRLKREQAADEFTSKIVRAIENGMSPPDEKWSKLDGVLCRHAKSVKNPKTQTVIPKSLRALVFELLHSKSGHLGVHKTLEKVKERFFWPGYEQDIREAVKKLNGSKFPLAVTDSITLARILTDEVICRYGVPESLHSDQGANFVSEVMQSLCAQLGIKRTQTSAYHPEGNGQVERFNRTLEAMLSKVVEEHQKDWDCHLQKVLFAFRTAVHESTGYTPLFVMSGRSPNLPIDVLLGRAQTQGQELPDYFANDYIRLTKDKSS